MTEKLEAAIREAAKQSGRANYESDRPEFRAALDAMDERGLRSSWDGIDICGIDGEADDILGAAWPDTLPADLRTEWDALSDEQHEEWIEKAVGIAKEEQAKLDIDEIKSRLGEA